jgi:hypothetical protein
MMYVCKTIQTSDKCVVPSLPSIPLVLSFGIAGKSEKSRVLLQVSLHFSWQVDFIFRDLSIELLLL